MWIDENGIVNVEAIWDDPWSVIAEDLAERLRNLSADELDDLASWVSTYSLMSMLEVRDEMRASPSDVEHRYQGIEVDRVTALLDASLNESLTESIERQAEHIDIRWRLDVLQALELALGELEADE